MQCQCDRYNWRKKERKLRMREAGCGDIINIDAHGDTGGGQRVAERHGWQFGGTFSVTAPSVTWQPDRQQIFPSSFLLPCLLPASQVSVLTAWTTTFLWMNNCWRQLPAARPTLYLLRRPLTLFCITRSFHTPTRRKKRIDKKRIKKGKKAR